MKELNVLSWGGGTQSTALMLKMLNGDILPKPDYIIFADTKNESIMVYNQIYKVIKYVKEKYNFDIIITKRNKQLKDNKDIISMIKNGLKYRSSDYSDLYQSHLLFFQGHLNSIDIMPLWTRNKTTGKIGKTKFKACTFAYKIHQLMKELKIQEKVKTFQKTKYKINMFIGYSFDELMRWKPNPLPYAENFAPLIDLMLTKKDCVAFVEKELGFTPKSSVCNMCYANDFERCYDVYKNDKQGWSKIVELDIAMRDKPDDHKLRDDVFMFRWQALLNKRLVGIDMEEIKKDKSKIEQQSLFDMEQEMACIGGCFL